MSCARSAESRLGTAGPDAADQSAPPVRTWRPMVLWTVGLLLALGAVWFIGALVVAPRVLLPRNERSAVNALRRYAEAQFVYRRSLAPGVTATFADELPKLRGLLPDEIIAAWGPDGRPYHGYLFMELKTIGGQPFDWVLDLGICAVPAKYGITGRRSFILATNGTVFGDDRGRQGGFMDDYPVNPIRDAWMVEE